MIVPHQHRRIAAVSQQRKRIATAAAQPRNDSDLGPWSAPYSAKGARILCARRAAKRGEQARIDTLAQVSRWYLQLKATNNECFLPLFFDEHRYLVLKGGGGSGKSIFAGRKVLERCASEPGHRFLVTRKVDKTIRESCFEQLKFQAYEYYADQIEKIPKGKSSDMYIKFKNGSEILFAGLDNVEKLKSIFNITGIWIEEASELLESDFNQLDIRLRTECPWYLQIILSFNPISITHWLKKRFFDFDISDPAARAEAIAQTMVHESTYKDNRFLTKAAIAVLEAFRHTDEYYYMVYCLGQWGVTGKSVFDAKAVTARLLENIRPIAVGMMEYRYDGLHITEPKWQPDAGGFIRIFKKPMPGVPYVIGCDTAGTGDGSDSFVAQVLDNRTGEQVAVLRHRFDEDVFARQVYCLGMYYNEALVGIETNFSTYPTMELERLGYPRMYVRDSIDEYTHKPKRAFGFRTDTKTRPVAIAGLIRAVRDDITVVSDETTLQEMLTFVRNEAYKPEAEDGAHDDCVMALAIAHYIRPQQSYLATAVQSRKIKWTRSMLADWENASESQRDRMREKWGEPHWED